MDDELKKIISSYVAQIAEQGDFLISIKKEIEREEQKAHQEFDDTIKNLDKKFEEYEISEQEYLEALQKQKNIIFEAFQKQMDGILNAVQKIDL